MKRLEIDSTGHIYLEPTPEVASGEIADPHVLRVNPTRDDGQEIAERVVECWNTYRDAPDLLGALQRLTHPMASDDDVEYARAAIAKATGEV